MGNDARNFYTICIEGIIDPDWADRFEGMRASYPDDPPRRTVLAGPVADQAALHGMLNRIRDLNLRLISVERGRPGTE